MGGVEWHLLRCKARGWGCGEVDAAVVEKRLQARRGGCREGWQQRNSGKKRIRESGWTVRESK